MVDEDEVGLGVPARWYFEILEVLLAVNHLTYWQGSGDYWLSHPCMLSQPTLFQSEGQGGDEL